MDLNRDEINITTIAGKRATAWRWREWRSRQNNEPPSSAELLLAAYQREEQFVMS
jgi:hypothetical protein